MAGISNSIVVVNFNAKIPLLALLKSLRMHEATNSELILVDSASFDGSIEAAEEQCPSAKILKLETNRGFWYAANKGIDRAEADVVVLCHADVLTDVHTLAELADQAREAGGRKTALMLPRVVGVDGAEQPIVGKLPTLGSALAAAIYPPAGLKFDLPMLEHLPENEWARFVCVAINRDALATIGGFDKRFFLYCGDTDLCARIHGKQQRIVFSKGVKVAHAGAGMGSELPEHLRRILRNDQQKYVAKHLPGWKQAVISSVGKVGGLFNKSG